MEDSPSAANLDDAVSQPQRIGDDAAIIAGLEAHVRLLRQEVQRVREQGVLCSALMAESPVGIAVYSALQGGEDFVFVDLNPAGQRLVDMSRDQVVGRCLSELFPGVRAMGLLDALEAAWRTGEPQRLPPREYRDRRIRLWVENHVVRLSTGHVASFFLDVSAWIWRRVEDGRGIVRFRRLYQRLHEGFCFVDHLGQVVEANPALEALLGVAPGGLEGRRWQELVSPAGHEVMAIIARLLEEHGSSPAMELELLGSAGPVPVHLSAYREEDGWWVMVRDASEARRLREVIAWRHLEATTLADLSQSLLTCEDLRELGRRVVEAAVRLTDSRYGFAGYVREDGALVSSASSLSMQQCAMKDHDLVFSEVRGLWAEAMHAGAMVVVDDLASHPLARGLPEGHVPITNFCAYPVVDAGRVVGEIAVANAAQGYRHERVESVLARLATVYALALRRAREGEALQRAQARIQQETAATSGQVRQMVDRLQVPVQILMELASSLEDRQWDPRTRGYVEGIGECARGLLRSLQQAELAFGQEIRLDEAVFDLPDALKDLVRRQMPLWTAKGLSLHLALEPTVPQWVRADMGSILLMLEQLLANALNHTQSGGARLAVFARPSAEVQDRIEIRMCVEDSGLGISEAQQASIAAFFLQGYGDGVGTGLAVVRRILTALEGTIQFSSRLGHGTVVCVTIPLYRAQPLQDAPAVLVVDDEPLQRDLLRRLLLGLGRFAIREVESGAAALRVLAQEPVHMVLVDMDLADMSGLEVARILREREHAAGQSPVPVFLVTGFAPEELPDTHHPQWGPLVQGVLQKPVPVDKLRTALEQAGLPVDAPWDDADALAQLGGDLQLLNDLRRMFAAEAPQRLSEGRAALERGDLATALRMFHALKGNAATIGATEVSTLARAVHDALRLGQVNEAVSLLPALQTALDRVGMVLKEKPHESTL